MSKTVSKTGEADIPPVAVEEHPPTLCSDYCIDDRNSSTTEVEVDEHWGLNRLFRPAG